MYQYAPLKPNGEAWLNCAPMAYWRGLMSVKWLSAFCAPPAIEIPWADPVVHLEVREPLPGVTCAGPRRFVPAAEVTQASHQAEPAGFLFPSRVSGGFMGSVYFQAPDALVAQQVGIVLGDVGAGVVVQEAQLGTRAWERRQPRCQFPVSPCRNRK